MVGGELVECLRNPDDSSQKRNAFSLEAIGITLPVIVLVVVQDDLSDLGRQSQWKQHSRSEFRMLLRVTGGDGRTPRPLMEKDRADIVQKGAQHE